MEKILLVTHVGDFIPQFEMDNVRYLQSQGYEVHYAANFDIASYGKGHILKDSGIICHSIPVQRSPFKKENIEAYRQLEALVERENFKAIHCHTPMGGALARLVGRKFRKSGMKVLYTVHGFHFFKGAPLKNWLLYYPAELLFSFFTDVLITINEEDYRRGKKLHAKKVVHIPGVGIDTERFGKKDLEDRFEFRRELGIAADDFCLLSVGELDDCKNHTVVIDALKGMDTSRIRYLICGKGERKEKLEQQIKANGLETCVKLLGYRNDVSRIYEASDAFIFPSHREGLPVALMEAMAKGLPAVVSKTRGNVDLIREGKGGYLVDSRKPEEFREKIEKLRGDADTCMKMGIYNQKAVRRFDRENTQKIMQKVYDEVLRRS